jgi:hypothetical protein
MDTRFTRDLKQAYEVFAEQMRKKGATLPKNEGKLPDQKLRHLDCAVLNWYLKEVDEAYDTVRCGFVEGATMLACWGSSGPIFNHEPVQGIYRDGV